MNAAISAESATISARPIIVNCLAGRRGSRRTKVQLIWGISRNVFELQRRRASCMRSLQGRSIVVLEGRRPSELAGLITRHGGRRRSVGSSLNHVMVVERTRASRSRSDRPSACSALARPKQRVGFWTLTLDTYSHVTQTMQVEVASRARRLLRSQPFHRWPRRADFDRRRPRWPGRLQPSRRGTGTK